MRGPLLLQVLIPRPLHSGLSVAIGARLLLKMRKSIAPRRFVCSQNFPFFFCDGFCKVGVPLLIARVAISFLLEIFQKFFGCHSLYC